MPSRRDLSPEDLELWRHVTRSVTAYGRARALEPEEKPHRATPSPKQSAAVATPVPKPKPAALALGRTADMDRNQARRLKRGELPIDGRLDLHGLTVERAHGALTAFIHSSYARGARVVVVITGKGPGGRGRLRTETPHWLNSSDLRPMVLAVTHAHRGDGGEGALYVLLKRRR